MDYTYPKAAKQQSSLGPLYDQLVAVPLPVTHVNGQPDAGQVIVSTSRALTAPEESQQASLVAAYDGSPRRARPLWAIRGDLQALSAQQWTNVWADLSAPVSGGPPRKYLTDYGINAGTIFVYDHVIYVVGGTAAQVKAGQVSLTACYVQDNPTFLVHPPFDPSIDISGDEPVP